MEVHSASLGGDLAMPTDDRDHIEGKLERTSPENGQREESDVSVRSPASVGGVLRTPTRKSAGDEVRRRAAPPIEGRRRRVEMNDAEVDVLDSLG